MTKLMISDLEMSQELSEKAMARVRGGHHGDIPGSWFGDTSCGGAAFEGNHPPNSWACRKTMFNSERTRLKPYTFYSFMRLGGR